jgi:hypothetical protein
MYSLLPTVEPEWSFSRGGKHPIDGGLFCMVFESKDKQFTDLSMTIV